MASRRWPLLLLAVMLAAGSRPAAEAARPLNPGKLAKPDYTIYHTKDGVFEEVRRIVDLCPGTMRLEEDAQADGDYSSTLTTVTVEPAGLSPPGADYSGKMRLLLNFGEHGRELISSEIGLHLLRLLCDATQRAPLLRRFKLEPAAVDELLQRTVFKIVPMENIRGREKVEAGQLCERKNGRGVDPNRNWAVHWGFKEKDYDPSEEYPGTGAFSEPEAALMLRAARALRPHVWASVHSGMEALFMPYDHKAGVPDGKGAAATLDILKTLNERTCRKRCATGSGGKSVGYLAHGTATDYMWQELHVPVPMTWEVYGDQKAHFEDCFRMFNPLTKPAFDGVVEPWTAAVFTLLTLLPNHPVVAAELAQPGGGGADAGGGGGAGGAGGAGGGAALGRHGGAGFEQEQQQQQQQQQATGSTGEAAAGSDTADKALEIASALKEHLQAEDSGEAAVGGGSTRRRGTMPKRGGMLRRLYWLVVAAAALGLAHYLWSKPRVRYLLSKHLGSVRRRSSQRLVPV